MKYYWLIFCLFISCWQGNKINFDQQGGFSKKRNPAQTTDKDYFFAFQQDQHHLFEMDQNEEIKKVSSLASGLEFIEKIWFEDQLYLAVQDTALNGHHQAGLYRYRPSKQDFELIYANSAIQSFAVFQGQLYFQAEHPQLGKELFRYNSQQVELVADINQGAQSSFPSELIVFNDHLYLSAHRNHTGVELYRYDGQQVELVRSIRQGQRGSFPQYFLATEDSLYFMGTHRSQNGSFSEGFYRMNQNETVSTLSNESNYEFYRELIISDHELFFSCNRAISNRSTLCAYDLQTQIIRPLLSQVNVSLRPSQIIAFEDHIYFSGFSLEHGFELYGYSLQDKQVRLIADLNTGEQGSYPQNFFIFNQKLYFQAYHPSSGSELYSIDSQQEIKLVKNLTQDSSSSYPSY